MSMQAYYFRDVDGETAFAAGYATAFSDIYLQPCCGANYCVEVDVFAEGEIGNINEVFKERIEKYNRFENSVKVNRRLKKLEYELVVKDDEPEKVLYDCLHVEKDIEDKKNLISSFLREMEYQLGKIEKVYELKVPGCSDAVFEEFYTYITVQVVVLKYEDAYLMVVFGSNE